MILLSYRGIDTSKMFQNPLFNNEEVQTFIKNNQELINKWEHFLESSVVYALYITEDVEKDNDIKSQTPIIDDSNYIGLNVVNLFNVPYFLEHFFLKEAKNPPSFFLRQFEEYMFKGKNLYEFFFTEKNQLLALFLAQLSNEVDNDLLVAATKEEI